MNVFERFDEIMAHVEDGRLFNSTSPDYEIIAIAVKRGGSILTCLGKATDAERWVVGNDVLVWENKVCWSTGAYFDTGYDALRHFNVIRDGAPRWVSGGYRELTDNFERWGGRINDSFDIMNRLWDVHSERCRVKDINGTTADLVSYEVLTARAMRNILYNIISQGDDPDTAYQRWFESDGEDDLDKAFSLANEWLE